MATRGKQEEELRKLSVEMRFLEQTAETLQQRLSMLNAAITDLSYANMTLDGVEKEKENAELLVPIGGGSYVKMKLASSDKIVVRIGAGVSVEKQLPEAKAIQPYAVAKDSSHKYIMRRLLKAILSPTSRKHFVDSGFQWIAEGASQ